MKCKRCREDNIPFLEYLKKQGVCDLCAEAKVRVMKERAKDEKKNNEQAIKDRMELVK